MMHSSLAISTRQHGREADSHEKKTELRKQTHLGADGANWYASDASTCSGLWRGYSLHRGTDRLEIASFDSSGER